MRWGPALRRGQCAEDCDLVFHASGTAAGLATALRLAGEEASIVERAGMEAARSQRRWARPSPVVGCGWYRARSVGRTIASRAVDSWAATFGGAGAAQGPGAGRAARAGRQLEELPTALPAVFGADPMSSASRSASRRR
jgi:hypothetical protein